MRLKSIKLVGFKSFVDPTVASFPDNLTAIVGPNGCGKSNIIDAVRWVMGESSAKTLRGESMADVIFNGSNSRKPVGQASIELVFDNSDGSLGGNYARYAEISIKRQVTRDGQSGYYLNGTKCRRKDITDIFLGTGLGPRSYAIIEQGMISRLIDAKPEELRVYIEEAAGISKYKERRRETENRMRRTRENLERLTDLREELDRQLAHLHRQAQAAEKYKEYKEEERLKKAQLHALKWQVMQEQMSQYEATIRDLEVKLEAVIADQRKIDAEHEEQRELHIESQDAFNEVQGRYYALGAEVARMEQTLQHQKERHQQLLEDLAQAEQGLEESQQHLASDKEQLESLSLKLETLEPEAERAQAAEELSSEKLLTAEERMHEWQSRWDEFNQRAAAPRQQAEVEQSRIQHLEQSIRRLTERVERLNQEKQNLQAGSTEQEVATFQEQAARLDEQLETLQAQSASYSETLNGHREQNASLSRELDQLKSSLQSARGRQASLEALQQAALEADTGVGQWLEQRQLDGAPRLADTLTVEAGWEKAVETVLGNYLQAVCVEDVSAIAGYLPEFQQGELVLVENASAEAAGGAAGTPLASKVTGQGAGLLAGIYAAETLDEALSLRNHLASGESVVTLDGIWLGAHWIRVVREKDTEAGVLKRKQELETLSEQIEQQQALIEEKEEALQAGREAIRELEAQRDECQKEISRLGREHGELSAQISAREVRLEQITMRRERLAGEIEESQTQIEEEKKQLAESRAALQEALDSMAEDTDLRESLLRERDEARQALDEARQTARHDKDHAHRLQLELQSARTQMQSITQGLERLQAQTRTLEERKQNLAQQLQQQTDPSGEVQAQLDELLEQRLQVEEELAAARRKLEEIEHSIREGEQRRHRLEQDAHTIRSTLEKNRMEWQALEVRRNTVKEQLIESQFDLETVLNTLPEEASVEVWEHDLERLNSRINRLGPINLAAIDEYKSSSERKEYLDSQDADLQKALNTLENAIRKIDRETRTRFKETFDRVNKGLGTLFPKVFGGGHAYLELTGDDLLDTGVAIMARPPGKRNSTIHLLSGGEKALTALSLVFSIFQLNPAPFCLLDEVDAPLDDANVGRFCKLVSEMSNTVQFIYISHNKIAMEMADTLLGVTMHEPGCSRLVSVDVNEAAELAAV